MPVKLLCVGLLAGIVCVSCGPEQPASAGRTTGKTLAGAADTTKAASQKQGEMRLPDAPVERTAAKAGSADAGAGAKSADVSDMPLAPKDAQWTIYCAKIADANHVETSRGLKAKLIEKTGFREWYIIHESDQSRLYYGYYRSIADQGDAPETARAQADRKKIDQMKDASGERPFAACQFVQLSAPDPDAPPQWNLVNAPPDKVWALMVGAYKDSPDRKGFAVEAVRAARAAGVEAYYFHGETVSNVFFGTWPESALEEARIDTDPGRRGASRDDLIILPAGIADPGKVTDKSGKTVRAVSQKLVPVDESLKKMIAKYPTMGVNGAELVYKVRGKEITEGSQVIRIPRPSQTSFRNDAAAAAQQAQTPNDGRGLDPADPFSRPGVDDSAARRNDAVKQSPPSDNATPGRLRSLGK